MGRVAESLLSPISPSRAGRMGTMEGHVALVGSSMGGEDNGGGQSNDRIPCQPHYDGIYTKIVKMTICKNQIIINELYIEASKRFDEAVERVWRQAVGDWIEENRG